jgi:hypothetical protein
LPRFAAVMPSKTKKGRKGPGKQGKGGAKQGKDQRAGGSEAEVVAVIASLSDDNVRQSLPSGWSASRSRHVK